MDSTAPLTQFPASAADHAAPAVAPDADFETRWAAWLARGRVHEQRVQRTFVTWVSVLAIGAGIVYAFFG